MNPAGSAARTVAAAALALSAPTVVSPPAAGSTSTASTVICTIDAPLATELSGLLATPTGYVAINDSRWDPREIRIFFFDQRCRIVKSIGYPTPARDPEDLAMAANGDLWVADIGDNTAQRRTVALWRLQVGAATPVIYRFTYPDGPHDAEALLLTPGGEPIIVTKELTARLYGPVRRPEPNTAAGVPLRLLGEVDLALVTGAAATSDGRRVALRTYSTAYEWSVPDGDPVAAILNTKPVATSLPGEPQGESIAYSTDNRALLTVSDNLGPTQLLRYPAAALPDPTTPVNSSAAAGVNSSPAAKTWLLPGSLALAIAIGLGGLWLARRRRQQRRRPEAT